ncbi:MAG TPA: ABC transporter permease [Dehalococcoidia bacterium]|jgi:peptide/nickel transport system permease protein|nr:ABC transporter permease [Dehalococcoidia bacterium]
MATSTAEIGVLNEPIISGSNWRRTAMRNIRRNPAGAFAGLVCLLLVLLAVFGQSIAPYDANRLDFVRLQPPSLDHPFGTDNLARDFLSRIIYGARNSLGVSFAAIAVSTIVGISLGISSGYLGGWVDMLVSRMIDIMLAYPAIVFVIFFVTIFGRDFKSVALAIGFILVPGTVRIVRSATIGVKHQQFIEAALSVGNSPLRIMYRHIFPNVAAPIIIIASVQIGVAILIEAAISFLGQGVSSAESPSWGRMLQETRPSWQLAWWTMVVPGAAISVAVVAFNMFGDALRDWLDPRLRGSR